MPDARGRGCLGAPRLPCSLPGLWDRPWLPGPALPDPLGSPHNFCPLGNGQPMSHPDNPPHHDHSIFADEDHTVLMAPGNPLAHSH